MPLKTCKTYLTAALITVLISATACGFLPGNERERPATQATNAELNNPPPTVEEKATDTPENEGATETVTTPTIEETPDAGTQGEGTKKQSSEPTETPKQTDDAPKQPQEDIPTQEPSPSPKPERPERHPLADTKLTPPKTLQRPTGGRSICDRTPEVQTAIIAALAEVGPELPCSAITPPELFRLRTLAVSAVTLKPRDLANLPNLHNLDLTTRVKRLRDLTPGTFTGMKHLKTLTLSLSHPRTDPPPIHTEELIPNLFSQLPDLAELTINIDEQSPALLLNKGPFRGLSRLKTLEVNHIHAVDPQALDHMKGLHAVTLKGRHELEATKQQTLPPDLLRTQLNLQRAQIQGLQLPSAITLASFEAACYAQDWLPKDDTGIPLVQTFVDRQMVELIVPGPEDKREGCLLRVGDNKIIEVATGR